MPGFITAPMGNPYDEPNLDLLPSGVAERVGWAPFTRQIGRGLEREAETGGLGPSIAQPNVDPDALNKQWGVTGPTPELSLKFDSPIPMGVAQEMNEAKHDEIARAYAERRSPGGVGSALADFGFGNLDPAGIAAGLVPVLGEGRMAELLGSVAATGISRLGVRAAEGAASGAAAMLPLTGLRYGLSQQEHADYSMSDAARDIAFGAIAGGVLHPLFGVLGDTFHPPVPTREVLDDPLTGLAVRDPVTRWMEAKPDVRAAAVEAAVAGVAEDRPVDVAGVGAKAAPRTPEEQQAQDAVARDIGIHGDEMAPGFEPPSEPLTDEERRAITEYSTANSPDSQNEFWDNKQNISLLQSAAGKTPLTQDITLYVGHAKGVGIENRGDFFVPASTDRGWAETMASVKWDEPQLEIIHAKKGTPAIIIGGPEREVLLAPGFSSNLLGEKEIQEGDYVGAKGDVDENYGWRVRELEIGRRRDEAVARAAGAPSPTDATTLSAADAAGAAKKVPVSTLSPELQSRLQDAELAFQHAQAAGMIRPDDPALTELATAQARTEAQSAAIAQAAFCARNAT